MVWSWRLRFIVGLTAFTLGVSGCGDVGSSSPVPASELEGSDSSPTDDVSLGTDSAAEADGGASIGVSDAAADSGPGSPVGSWCEGALGGRAGVRSFAADLASAHGGFRLFGPQADWLSADATLVELLEGDSPFEPGLLAAYAARFEDVCAAPATDAPVATTTVEMKEGIAWVRPGTDAPVIPEDASAIVVDLRDVGPGANVMAAAASAVQGMVSLGQRRLRYFQGFPSQDQDWTHYETQLKTESLSLEGSADQDRPLVFVTGARLSPEAARVAGALRMAGRAFIVGAGLYSALAESTWSGVGEGGLLWRSAVLLHDQQPWPDVIPAHRANPDAGITLDDLAAWGQDAVTGAASRQEMAPYERGAGLHDADLSRGAMRAALVVAYGNLDRFYPYFDVVGRDIDPALTAGLAMVDETEPNDRPAMRRILGHFMYAIHDGHGFYADEARDDWSDGYLGLQIQRVNDEPMVRRSIHPEVQAGDVVETIDGIDSALWYEEAMSRYSASSVGYRFVLATDEWKEVYGSRELGLRRSTGEQETVVLQGSWDNFDVVPWGGTDRPSGWLDDLDAPGVYYVNMAASITPDESPIVAIFDQLMNADGIVLDMRDYPYLDIYEFARFWHTTHFTAPIFGHPTWTGPDDFAFYDEVWSWDPADMVYTGPIVLMVSNKTVSAGECFAQIIMDLPNVTVVGQQSASTNGTITNAKLPGQFQMTWTGMWLRNPDGSEFHGIGVVPDVEVVPTADEFAAGVDPELMAARDVLLGP